MRGQFVLFFCGICSLACHQTTHPVVLTFQAFLASTQLLKSIKHEESGSNRYFSFIPEYCTSTPNIMYCLMPASDLLYAPNNLEAFQGLLT